MWHQNWGSKKVSIKIISLCATETIFLWSKPMEILHWKILWAPFSRQHVTVHVLCHTAATFKYFILFHCFPLSYGDQCFLLLLWLLCKTIYIYKKTLVRHQTLLIIFSDFFISFRPSFICLTLGSFSYSPRHNSLEIRRLNNCTLFSSA